MNIQEVSSCLIFTEKLPLSPAHLSVSEEVLHLPWPVRALTCDPCQTQGKLDQVAEEVRSLGVKCLPVKCDVNDLEEVKAALDTILTEFGKVDILINNAGGGTSMPILEMTDEAYFKDINTDLLGLFKCLREFGKVMVKQGYGRIINIASILGLVGEKTAFRSPAISPPRAVS